MNLAVTRNAMRPGSGVGRCFYCREPIGGKHRPDCVLIQKTVKVRAVLEYNVEVPHFWDKGDIEFHRNESSWCSSNLIDELSEMDCLCGIAVFECLDDTGEPKLKEWLR